LNRLTIQTETWGREACELIDYDSSNLHKQKLEVKESGNLYRSENDIIFSKEENENFEKLSTILYFDNKFEIVRNNYEEDEEGNVFTPNTAWFLLKTSKMDQKMIRYKIHQGEIIKLGRIITRIKDIKYDKSRKNNLNTTNNNKDNSIVSNSTCSNNFLLKDIDKNSLIDRRNVKSPKMKEKLINLANQRNNTDSDFQEKVQILSINNVPKKEKEKECKINSLIDSMNKKKEKLCRICYMEEDEQDNPIIQSCHCSGSCKYIHLNCLKKWIMTKSCSKVDQNEYSSVYTFSEVKCEICNSKFPDFVNHNGKLYGLLDFTEDFKSYFILESLTLDKENNKFLYIISLDKNQTIKVGRGQSCEILLSDASISRLHCLFIMEGKNIYIEDNNSKFGTLILIQSPTIKIAENLPLHIQIGRTYLRFLCTTKWNLFECCGISENPNLYYYHKQNERQIDTNRVYTVKTEIDNNSEEEVKEKNDNIKNNTNNHKNEIIEIINDQNS
jgi:hypothetical protein